VSSLIAPYLFYIIEGHSLAERLEGLGKGGHAIKSPTISGVALVSLLTYAYSASVKKYIVLIVTVSSLVFILLAQSRGIVLSLLVVHIVALLLTRNTKQLVAVVVIFVSLVTYAYLGGTMGHFSSFEFVRGGIWLEAITMARESLILGYGIYPEQAITVPAHGMAYVHPHNIFISHLLYGGVLGLSVLLFLVGSLIRSSWKAWVKDGNLMLILLVIYFLAVAMFDYSTLIRSPDVEWLLFWWAVGLVVAYEARANVVIERQ
jgi:O-antigen ligase